MRSLIFLGLAAVSVGGAIAGCSYRAVPNWVHSNRMDLISGQTVGSDEECLALCDAQPTCLSAITEASTSWCYTQSRVDDIGQTDNRYVMHYKQSCDNRPACSFRGQTGDLSWHGTRVMNAVLAPVTLEQCRLNCDVNPSCTSFLRNIAGSTCYLNSALTMEPGVSPELEDYAKAECPAVQPLCEFEELVGHYPLAQRTSIVISLGGMDKENCSRLCAAQPNCAFYTFDTQTGSCSTSSGTTIVATPRGTDARYVTGWRKACQTSQGTPLGCRFSLAEGLVKPHSSRTDIVTAAERSLPLEMPSEAECLGVCGTLEACVAWVWRESAKACWLSSAIPGDQPVVDSDYRSGIKAGCDGPHPASGQATHAAPPETCHLHTEETHHFASPRTAIVEDFPNVSPAECHLACRSNPNCFSAILSTDKRCFLESHEKGGLVESAPYRSFTKALCIDRSEGARARCKYIVREGGYYADANDGNRINGEGLAVVSREACEDVCDAQAPRCIAYNFANYTHGNGNGMSSGWCHTIEHLAWNKVWGAVTGYSTGLRHSCGPSREGRCFFARRIDGRFLSGRSALGPETQVPSEQACQDSCLATLGCVAYESRQPGDSTFHCTLLDRLDPGSPATPDPDPDALKHDTGWLTFCGDDVWTKGYTRVEEVEMPATESQLANVLVSTEEECRRMCDAATLSCRGYAYSAFRAAPNDSLPTCTTLKSLGTTLTPSPGTGEALHVVALKALKKARVGGAFVFVGEQRGLPTSGVVATHADADDLMCGHLCGEREECWSFGVDGAGECQLYSVGAELGPQGPQGAFYRPT